LPCEDIMVRNPDSLSPDTPLWDGLMMLAERGHRIIPLVSGDRQYQGALTRLHLLSLVLPDAVTIEDGLKNLGFVRGQMPVLRARLEAGRHLTLQEVLQRHPVDVPTIKPGTAIMEAIWLMYKDGFGVPVVDDDNRLLGLVTGKAAVRALKQMPV